jgi:hypothetical protein
LPERFTCPSPENVKGVRTHLCQGKDHPWHDGEEAHQLLRRDGDAEHEQADRDGVGGDNDGQLPLQSHEQPELVQNIPDNVAELVLGE